MLAGFQSRLVLLKTSNAQVTLSAHVHVVVENVGQGTNRRAIRRALLIDRESGLIHELPSVFVLRELSQNASNTQQTILYDLAFFFEWMHLKASRSGTWVRPEARLRAGHPALSEREIVDLRGRCQSTAAALVLSRQREGGNVRVVASPKSVGSSTTNRRLRNISRYLVWLTQELIEGTLHLHDRDIARSVHFKESLRESFAKHMSAEKKPSPFLSLNKGDANAVRLCLASPTFFPNTPAGRRDRIIGKFLLDSGLRAGELLKLQCGDVNDNYDLDGRAVAVVKVIRRPNDPADERISEPAVKTLPGPVVINRRLASTIIEYVISDRRAAVDRRTGAKETPYLFVNHSGPHIGKPISQRNLNRIVAKLNSVLGTSDVLSPHTLRHTHFTEMAEICAASGRDERITREILRDRGHWSPQSEMPARYTSRFTAAREAELVDERDRLLESRD